MNFITDDFRAIVHSMRAIDDDGYPQSVIDYMATYHPSANLEILPDFMAGHRLEIANRVERKDGDVTNKVNKYPLIALRMDIGEPYESGGMYHYPNLNIAIVTFTKEEWNAEERVEKVLKPFLAPLYDRFMKELEESGFFSWEEGKMPPHTPIFRPFWGTASTEKNVEHLFTDPVDCLEIVGLDLYRNINC